MTSHRESFNLSFVAAACGMAMAAGLAACGGGDSTAPPASTTGTFTISGTAARGAAVAAGQIVDVKCATGDGTTTVATDGSYSIKITDGALPCALEVTDTDGSLLVSIAQGAGSNITAHLTPLTHLVVADLTGSEPGTWFSEFGSSDAAAITPTALAAAQAEVVGIVESGGIDLGAVGDVFTAALIAANGSTAGNAYDQALEAMARALGDISTLDDLARTVAINTTTTTTTLGSVDFYDLPPDLLLRPAASNCTALRTGDYRIMLPHAGVDNIDGQIALFHVDAQALTYTLASGATVAMTATGPCQYTANGGTSDIVITPAGVLFAHFFDASLAKDIAYVGFPEQSHSVSELAGTWNAIGMETNANRTALTGVRSTNTIDGTGAITAGTWCQNDDTWNVSSSCAADTGPFPTLASNAAGGFDSLDADGSVQARVFTYRAGNGDSMVMAVNSEGGYQLFTKQLTRPLPEVGDGGTWWSRGVSEQLLPVSALNVDTNTVTSIDAANGSFVRKAARVGATDPQEHSETLFNNQPVDGYRWRPQASTTTTSGAAYTIKESTALYIRGMGLVAGLHPVDHTFWWSAWKQ